MKENGLRRWRRRSGGKKRSGFRKKRKSWSRTASTRSSAVSKRRRG
jgi:hypothetical protein